MWWRQPRLPCSPSWGGLSCFHSCPIVHACPPIPAGLAGLGGRRSSVLTFPCCLNSPHAPGPPVTSPALLRWCAPPSSSPLSAVPQEGRASLGSWCRPTCARLLETVSLLLREPAFPLPPLTGLAPCSEPSGLLSPQRPPAPALSGPRVCVLTFCLSQEPAAPGREGPLLLGVFSASNNLPKRKVTGRGAGGPALKTTFF